MHVLRAIAAALAMLVVVGRPAGEAARDAPARRGPDGGAPEGTLTGAALAAEAGDASRGRD